MLQKKLLLNFVDMNISSAYEMPNEILLVETAVNTFIEYLEERLSSCLNAKNGKCNIWWKHDDCKVIMDMLFDITLEEQYKAEYSVWD